MICLFLHTVDSGRINIREVPVDWCVHRKEKIFRSPCDGLFRASSGKTRSLLLMDRPLSRTDMDTLIGYFY